MAIPFAAARPAHAVTPNWKSLVYAAIFSLAAVISAKLLLGPVFPDNVPLTLFLIPIVLTAYFGDTKASFLASVLGGVAGSYWSFSPIGSFRVDDAADQIRLGAFIVVAGGIGWLTSRVSQANRRLQQAVIELKQTQDRLQLVLRELRHRIRNMLATIDSLSFQTARHSQSLPEFQRAFSDRVRALAKVQDILSAAHWSTVQVREIVAAEISVRMADGCVRMDGPQVWLDPQQALALHMVIHELCTNATKYGALSQPTGRIFISWSVEKEAAQAVFRLHWIETGGPRVEPPTRRGFGSELLEQSLEYELGGSLNLSYPETGVTCELSFPCSHPLPDGAASNGADASSLRLAAAK